MEVTTGLFPRMVLQRARDGRCDAQITGIADADGPVHARVRRGRKTLSGFSRPIGKAARGRFTARLRGLAAGGPYDIELSIPGEKPLLIRDVLVGDVWIAAGQSNMQGCGLIRFAAKPQPMVRAFYMNDRWDVARDPIHNMHEAVDPVHAELCGGNLPGPPGKWGTGPAVAFAQAIQRALGVPQGVIACAHGGTSMQQWDPALPGEGGASLYGTTLRRFRKNGSRVAGMIWYQGESDCTTEAAPHYTQRMRGLVRALRRDTRQANLPVAIVQIARVVEPGRDSRPWNSIQEQQRRLPDVVPHLATTPAIDLPLDDLIHIGGEGPNILGRRLAEAMLALLRHKQGAAPIALKKISLRPASDTGACEVVVEFANVKGKLSGHPPSGFFVGKVPGDNIAFDVSLEGARVVLRTGRPRLEIEDLDLHYGAGVQPICNVTDAAGRSLPVLGPIALGTPRALTPFIQAMHVRALEPTLDKLHETVALDASLPDWTPREFPQRFCSRREEIVAAGKENHVAWHRIRFRCDEPMKLSALLGYDGPVKLFFNGREIYHDPAGTNPAVPDARRIPISAGAGEHELQAALGSNNGAAWGIFLRLQRRDVPRKTLLAGDWQRLLPVLL